MPDDAQGARRAIAMAPIPMTMERPAALKTQNIPTLPMKAISATTSSKPAP